MRWRPLPPPAIQLPIAELSIRAVSRASTGSGQGFRVGVDAMRRAHWVAALASARYFVLVLPCWRHGRLFPLRRPLLHVLTFACPKACPACSGSEGVGLGSAKGVAAQRKRKRATRLSVLGMLCAFPWVLEMRKLLPSPRALLVILWAVSHRIATRSASGFARQTRQTAGQSGGASRASRAAQQPARILLEAVATGRQT